MEIYVISSPENFYGEYNVVAKLLELDRFTFHLRKPFATIDDCCFFLNNIPTHFHSKIVLHQHHSLSNKFNVKGLHFKEKDRISKSDSDLNSIKSVNSNLTLSTSIHELDKFSTITIFDYIFVSPVYDSISKEAYHSKLVLADIKNQIIEFKKISSTKIIALGGVTSEKLPELHDVGFDGAAFLGAVWKNSMPNATLKQIIQNASQL